MDFQEYRKRGKEMVDYIADYLENIRDRRVFPDVKPGYMHNLLPESAPIDGEKWENIINDIEHVIMPGITHWQSPHMHAYFPALNSFPSMLGDMLADAINCLGFTWASSPACTELETIVMNWLGKMIGLPDEFLHLNSSSKGGGVIQTTASESTLVCLLAGRTQAIKKFHEQTPGYQDAEINARLVAYCSDQAHSSVEKAALIGLVRMRYIESNDELIMRGQPLREAIENDIKQGLIPFWVCCTLGTTGACAFDNLDEIGNVCRDFGLWLHIDAAYAGSALICPEYRAWLKGVEKANSIAFNPSKWLMVHFDCTAMWVRDSTAVHRTFNVEPLYLQHENSGLAIDYMHWQIPLSKRFRSLKLWFVLRSFGIRGLQKHIREGVRLAQKFEALVLADHRFEIPAKRYLGMVVFRIKGENELTEKLLKRLNHRGKLHCVPASLKGKYVIRFTVTSTQTTIDDILEDWTEIKYVTTELLNEMNVKIDRAKISLKDTKEKNEAFGSSLLLSNSPMSPKVVNGSFAAIFDADEFLAKTYAGIRIANPTKLPTNLPPPLRPILKRPTNFENFQHQDSPSMRRRVRGILMSGKQFSLDSRMDLVVQSCYDSNNEQNQENPIREDNEEVLEVYESPGTPPITPPPTISPMIYRHLCQLQRKRHSQQLSSKQNLTTTKLPIEPIKYSSTSLMKIMQPLAITSTSSIHPEKLDLIRVPNKYKLVNKLTKSLKPSTYTKDVRDTNQTKIIAENATTKLAESQTNFDKTIQFDENNKIYVKNIEGQNNIIHNISTDSSKSDEINFNFKSTVNTVIVKQNCNVNRIQSMQNYENELNTLQKNSNNVNLPDIKINLELSTSSPTTTTTTTDIYHGKRFLEQTTNDGIFAFYNLAFRDSKSIQKHSSISDILEEDIATMDSVDWEAVKNNFNKPDSVLSSYSVSNLNRSIESLKKIKLNNDFNFKSQNSVESLANKQKNEFNNFSVSKKSLSLTGLKSLAQIETTQCIKTSSKSLSNSSVDETSTLSSKNENIAKKSEIDDEISSNESNDDETTSTTTPTSCFSQPISLWSSLEVNDLLHETDCSTPKTFQISSVDGWTIIPGHNNITDNSEVFDICKKCGHNSNIPSDKNVCKKYDDDDVDDDNIGENKAKLVKKTYKSDGSDNDSLT